MITSIAYFTDPRHARTMPHVFISSSRRRPHGHITGKRYTVTPASATRVADVVSRKARDMQGHLTVMSDGWHWSYIHPFTARALAQAGQPKETA